MKANFHRRGMRALLITFLSLEALWIGVCVLWLCMRWNTFGHADIILMAFIALFCMLMGIVPFLYNYKAYLKVGKRRIEGKFGFWGRISCDLSEVEYVFAERLKLTVLSKGRRYDIRFVKNAYALCVDIQKRMSFTPLNITGDMIKNVKQHNAHRKKDTVMVFVMVGLGYALMFLTVFLTGMRDLSAFSQTDWIIFSIMCILEVIFVVLMFRFALRTGRRFIAFEKAAYQIRRTVIESTPLPETMIDVFTDASYSSRSVLYGDRDSDKVLFVFQMFDEDYRLFDVYQSDNFEDEVLVGRTREGMIDITETFLNQK